MKIVAYTIFLLILSGCGEELRSRSSRQGSNTDAFTDGSGCPALYKPVCGQPPMPVCPQGTACVQMMPSPVSYDNECQMQKAGATFIKEGNCS